MSKIDFDLFYKEDGKYHVPFFLYDRMREKYTKEKVQEMDTRETLKFLKTNRLLNISELDICYRTVYKFIHMELINNYEEVEEKIKQDITKVLQRKKYIIGD